MNWYAQNQGFDSLNARLEEIYSVYHANDESFTRQDALEEFTAEATAGLFSTEDGAQDFVDWLQNESGYTAEQKKTVLQRVAELFQRIVDRIKELIGEGNLSEIAADFAEAQADEAARLRQMFLQVLDGMEVTEGSEGGERFSIKQSTEGFDYVEVDEDAIDLNDGRSVASVIAGILDKKFNNVITANKQFVRINSKTNREWRHSKTAKALYTNNQTAYNDKVKAIANADELLTTAKEWINEERKHQSFDSFARGKVWYKVGNNGYSADIIVGLKNDGSATLYDLVEINEYKIEEASLGRASDRIPSRKDTSSENTITTNKRRSQHFRREKLFADGGADGQAAAVAGAGSAEPEPAAAERTAPGAEPPAGLSFFPYPLLKNRKVSLRQSGACSSP